MKDTGGSFSRSTLSYTYEPPWYSWVDALGDEDATWEMAERRLIGILEVRTKVWTREEIVSTIRSRVEELETIGQQQGPSDDISSELEEFFELGLRLDEILTHLIGRGLVQHNDSSQKKLTDYYKKRPAPTSAKDPIIIS